MFPQKDLCTAQGKCQALNYYPNGGVAKCKLILEPGRPTAASTPAHAGSRCYKKENAIDWKFLQREPGSVLGVNCPLGKEMDTGLNDNKVYNVTCGVDAAWKKCGGEKPGRV